MTTANQLMDLRGRTAIITGATGYLGSTMARTLAELGAGLILVDRPGSDFGALQTSLEPFNVNDVDCRAVDLEADTERNGLIEAVKEQHASLDILINNAAFVGTSDLGGWSEPLERQTIETWRRVVEVNLTAPFHLCQQFAPLLRGSRGASIVNIGSIYGHCAPDYSLYEGTKMSNPGAYAASKGGLIQLTRWLSTTLAPDIRVNAISPGGVFRNQPKSFVERYEARTPLGRMATEDDFIGAVSFLSTDLSRYVTGQNLCVDGGWSIW